MMAEETLTAAISSPVGSASNVALAAAILEIRGFMFDSRRTKERHKQPTNYTSFSAAWEKFIRLVKVITDLPDGLPEGRATRSSVKQPENAEEAFIRFFPVMATSYSSEALFQNTLMYALNQSLGNLCEQCDPAAREFSPHEAHNIPKTTFIRLRSSDVMFVTEVKRIENLQFHEKYGMASRSKFDIACVVTRGNLMNATAVVELKIGDTSCKEYDFVGEPKLSSDHAALAQAIFYNMEVWHCFAREGYEPEQPFPVLVVAAKKEDEASHDRLCCLLASLHIPNILGERFRYQVNRCIKFPQTDDEANELYRQALSVFIETLCTGLEHAVKLLRSKNQDPVTLCCSPPHPDLRLIASPIPEANSSVWKISQGELHKVKTKGTIRSWMQKHFGGIKWRSLVFADENMAVEQCIIKISFKAVHNWLIPCERCWRCLETISAVDELKAAVAKVLRVCLYNASTGCLIIVMRDLTLYSDSSPIVASNTINDPSSRQPGISNAVNLEPIPLAANEYRNRGSALEQLMPLLLPTPTRSIGSLPARFEALQRMIANVLLPMARIDVIHTDIRYVSVSREFQNLLCFNDNGHMEMMVVDFESLSEYQGGTDFKNQPYAISVGHLDQCATAFLYLFWQVLWVAYVWCPMTTAVAMAVEFVELFSSADDRLMGFKEWVGVEGMKQLETIWKNLESRNAESPRDLALNEKDIEDTLNILHMRCCQQSSSSEGHASL